jgi:hypothetical protein
MKSFFFSFFVPSIHQYIYIGTSNDIITITKENNVKNGNLHIAPFIFLKWTNDEIVSSFEIYSLIYFLFFIY